MTGTAAVMRARLGAALRALPSELVAERCAPRSRQQGIHDDVPALARELERVSPGLALMMQLRARVLDDATQDAAARGFDQLVVIGCGFDDRRLRRLARGGAAVVEVEHPAVLAAKRRRRAGGSVVTQVPADDFVGATWTALEQRRLGLRERKSFVVLQGLSMWGSAMALAEWLDRLANDAAPGSEVLLNVLEAGAAVQARAAVPAARPGDAAPALAVPFGVDAASLRADIEVRGLRLLGLFDSSDVQRRHLGSEDLIVRELYVRLGTAIARPTGVALALAPPARRASRCRSGAFRRGDRPCLRRGVDVRTIDRASAIISWSVTALRTCHVVLTARELAVASLCDGTRTVTEITAALGAAGTSYAEGDVGDVVAHLRARAALAADEGADEAYAAAEEALRDDHVRGAIEAFHAAAAHDRGHLGALRELGLLAIERYDTRLAARVRRALGAFAGNRAADHLAQTLHRCAAASGPRVARREPLAVFAAGARAEDRARSVLTDAHDLLTALARLLQVGVPEQVVVDVSTARVGLPLTMVADAEPYTLVAIPLPVYSRALLCHELVHVLAMSASPWLSEGLAVWAQRVIEPGPCFPDDRPCAVGDDQVATLAARLRADVRADLRGRSLLGRAEYVEAADFVDYVVRTHGMAMLARFFAACRVGADSGILDQACRALGVTSVADLERAWRRGRS